jgi:hypothetical protein
MLARPRRDDRFDARSEPAPAEGRHVAAALVALGAAAASMAVYRSILGAYFWNDDFTWLYLLHDRSLAEFLLTPMGGHSLVARNAVLALTDTVAGFDPRPYFATMLLTHGLNVALLAGLIWRLTNRVMLAGVGALAWGTCPSASETLAWYSVYGQVAATACILLALHRVAARARNGDVPSVRDIAIVTAWLVLSSLFFGTALGVALVWPLVSVLLFPGIVRYPRRVGWSVGASAAVLGLYALLQVLASRLYAAPMIPVDTVQWLVASPWRAAITFLQLVRVGIASLCLGTWWHPAPRSDGLSWLLLLAAACGWMGALAVAPSRQRGMMLGFLLLALAVYALVAVARGPISATLMGRPGAAVAATPRYHYAAQALLVVSLCAGIDAVASRLRSSAFVPLVAWGCTLVAAVIVRGVAVERHETIRTEVTRVLTNLRAQVARAQPGETVYVANTPVLGFGWMPNSVRSPPGLAALFIITSRRDEIDGRAVRFVEPDPAVAEPFMRHGGRTARLLVSSAGDRAFKAPIRPARPPPALSAP